MMPRRFVASVHKPWESITPVRAFDPDADRYDWEHPREGQTPDELWEAEEEPDDEREVPVPFDQVCECGLWKSPDNAVCEDCHDRQGGPDHA